MASTRSVFNVAMVSAFALSVAAFATILPGAAHAEAPPAPGLVTPAWLKVHLHDPNQVIIEVYDTNAQKPAYEAGHIPGAVFTGFLSEPWRTTVNGVRGMLPPPAEIAKVIGGYGIGNATRVILVPGGRTRGDFNVAARIFWTLRIEGQDNVSILDGGDHAWLADPTDPVATGDVAPTPVAFVPQRGKGYLATLERVQNTLSTHEFQLVDARPPAQFDGKVKSPVDARAGTLPGALNLPYSMVLTSDGEGVRPMSELSATLQRAGITRNIPTITFSNTGHLASTAWFVLREVFANPKVRLYDGSMAEWSADPSRPMVNGHSPF